MNIAQEPIYRMCPICERTFTPLPQQIRAGKGVYCSLPCWYVANTRTLAERFWEKVNKNGPVPQHRPDLGPCWPWTGARFAPPREYGVLGTKKGESTRLAHRIAWELVHGPIPKGLQVLHACDFPPCVRTEPDNKGHLFLGTQKDNIQDMISKGRNGPQRDPKHHAHGEQHGRAKLTAEQIQEIRARYAAGGISQMALAAEYGIGQSHLSRIVLALTWRS